MTAPDHSRTLYESKREQRVVFFLVFMGVLALTFLFFFAVDFLPEKPDQNEVRGVSEHEMTESDTGLAAAIEEATIDLHPSLLIIESLDKRIAVQNPESTSIAALDEALLSGAVRHPDSADFENEGTIFLFGHSSYLPNVINKNFQAFNGIQNLAWGDTIKLQSRDTEYVYRVDRVYQVKASDAEVKIERGEAKLTLATCNTFGSKDDRYIVEASLVTSRQL